VSQLWHVIGFTLLRVCFCLSGIECDLNINNSVGIRNTHLLSAYSHCESICLFMSIAHLSRFWFLFQSIFAFSVFIVSICWRCSLNVLFTLLLATTGYANKKTCHFTFVHIFASYCPIFKIFSLAHSTDNFQ